MNPEANRAAQSSAVSYPFPKYKAIDIPINAAIDVIASLLWCQASAFNEELFVSFAFFITNWNEISFQIINGTRTNNVQNSGSSSILVKD